jgi:hypothetical protein
MGELRVRQAANAEEAVTCWMAREKGAIHRFFMGNLRKTVTDTILCRYMAPVNKKAKQGVFGRENEWGSRKSVFAKQKPLERGGAAEKRLVIEPLLLRFWK